MKVASVIIDWNKTVQICFPKAELESLKTIRKLWKSLDMLGKVEKIMKTFAKTQLNLTL